MIWANAQNFAQNNQSAACRHPYAQVLMTTVGSQQTFIDFKKQITNHCQGHIPAKREQHCQETHLKSETDTVLISFVTTLTYLRYYQLHYHGVGG